MAETLLLLPGMMSDARVFSDQILTFTRERAVQLAPVWQGGSVASMARELLEGAPKQFALVGHGLGGVIAMDVLRQAPERVSRVAFMSCTPLAETPQEAAAREPRIVSAQAGQLEKAVREEFPSASFAPGPMRAQAMNMAVNMASEIGPELFVRQSRALQRRPDQQKILRQLRAPALVLCGAHDTLTPLRRHEFMSELIPNATLEVIEDAGHLPLLEAPEAVTEALRKWLAAPFRLT
ncbi:alpha/beta fold hydrolase [Actibacterium lipolyticum]|uniref:Pimeloyl-[acyl-carrier protein] methyl ester esterase n=1 Tax=Actibacterium lipolyticum TaxID=1524263 RepID=A0A238KLL8_9RHOB|nr:alpha/beta hydrolase [Actibacterium lipolyticum]SMX43517.1 Pimeloyl-[acyl-carrier protein] methyl ester esterase [Actibacterium lipolyticum]